MPSDEEKAKHKTDMRKVRELTIFSPCIGTAARLCYLRCSSPSCGSVLRFLFFRFTRLFQLSPFFRVGIGSVSIPQSDSRYLARFDRLIPRICDNNSGHLPQFPPFTNEIPGLLVFHHFCAFVFD